MRKLILPKLWLFSAIVTFAILELNDDELAVLTGIFLALPGDVGETELFAKLPT